MKLGILLALAMLALTGCLPTDATGGTDPASSAPLLIMLVLMVGAMYLLMWRPQKKKEKQAQELRNSIEVGDEVTTIGGIVGRVVSIKEDTFVIETAGERSRMRFKRWAIQDVGKLSLESSSGSSDVETPAEPAEKRGLFGFGKKKTDE